MGLRGPKLSNQESKDRKQLHLHLFVFCTPSSLLMHPASIYDLTLCVSLARIMFLTNSDVFSTGGRLRNSRKEEYN